MTTFTELTKEIHLIEDLILSDMTVEDNASEEAINFSKRLISTKYCFVRISFANKKKFVLELLEDVRSAWTLSLLLKCIWNCRPKDAVLSVCERKVWSSFDQGPMDHNRIAQPFSTFAKVMESDRVWFQTLDPQSQAIVLLDLLAISGGPIVWEILKRAQVLFERYREYELQILKEGIINDRVQHQTSPEKIETNLASWNATMQSIRDNLKIDEIEMTLKDGTKKKIWKLNRPKPEHTETVDFLQLLPSSIGKRILSYLPHVHLVDYARVNKYWAYLVEDFRAEMAARQKINEDLNKLKNLIVLHDKGMKVLSQTGLEAAILSYQGIPSTSLSKEMKQMQPSVKICKKLAGAYTNRSFLRNNLKQPVMRNKKRAEGVLPLSGIQLPCSLLKDELGVPFESEFLKDSVAPGLSKPSRKNSNDAEKNMSIDEDVKRYSLWTKDFSSLYPVLKIPSYQLPV